MTKRLFGVVKGHREHIVDHTGRLYSDSEVADLLNTVHEENKQLKTQLQNTSDQRNEFYRGVRENANRVGELEKENKRIKSDLAKVIEQANKNDKFLRSDMKILKNALWCPNCANDIKRLKKLRKEFLE